MHSISEGILQWALSPMNLLRLDPLLSILDLTGGAKKKKASGSAEEKTNAKQGNDLDILFDMSFADNLTLNHLLDQEADAKPTRGSKDITISPAIRYDVNKNVNLRFFVDFRKQEPYVSNQYKVITTEGGVTVRISLE